MKTVGTASTDSTILEEGKNVRIYLQMPGMVVPGWIGFVFALALILSTLGFILSLVLTSNARTESARLIGELKDENVELRREVRLLQLHTQDVENILIRYNFANRDDLAPWPKLVRDDPPIKREDLEER